MREIKRVAQKRKGKKNKMNTGERLCRVLWGELGNIWLNEPLVYMCLSVVRFPLDTCGFSKILHKNKRGEGVVL